MKRFKIKKLNNDGAALVFAIMVVTFITILTTLLMYLATTNFEMKSVDYHTRVSFYGSEIPLEELRMQMAVDVSQAAEVAYESVLLRYSILGTEDARKAEYQKVFYEEIESIWALRTGVNWEEKLETALNNNSNYDVRFKESTPGTKAWQITVLTNPVALTGKEQLYRDEARARIIFQNVQVSYTKDDFTSEIITDICITVPEVDWSVNTFSSPSGLTAAEAARTKINYEEYVTYLNWTKE